MDSENFSLPGIEDIVDLTDSEDSSSSSNPIFNSHEPFVLELHDLVKDAPGTQSVDPSTVKKHKKKKKIIPPHIKSHTSDSSTTVSESTVPSTDEPTKEEFFDAHESYHTMPGMVSEFPVSSPKTATSLMQTHSENLPNPKGVQTSITQRSAATSREPPPSTTDVAFEVLTTFEELLLTK